MREGVKGRESRLNQLETNKGREGEMRMDEGGGGGEVDRIIVQGEGGGVEVEHKIEVGGEILEGGEEEVEIEAGEEGKGMLRLYRHAHLLIDLEEGIRVLVPLDYPRDQRLIFQKELEVEFQRIGCRLMLVKHLLSHHQFDSVNRLPLEEEHRQQLRNLRIKVQFLNLDRILVNPQLLPLKVTTLKCLIQVNPPLTLNNHRVITEPHHPCTLLHNLITHLHHSLRTLSLPIQLEVLTLLINHQLRFLHLLHKQERLQ